MSHPEMGKLLPPAGERRFWRITHNPKSRVNPIVITLMECISGTHKGLARAIGFEWTIADPHQIAEAAELVLARVGDYADVVGDYDGNPELA